MTRVETFSDAVIAIAATLLVLELPFDKVGQGDLAHALGEHWPRFAAYAVSFLTIGIMWLHHHAIFGVLARVDRRLLMLNLVMLLGAAFLPFPTSLIGDYLKDGGEDARVAALTFSATWTTVTAAAWLMCSHALRTPGLVSSEIGDDRVERLLRMFQLGTAAYIVFTLVAVVSPIAMMGCYAAATAYFLARSDYRALGEDTVERPRR